MKQGNRTTYQPLIFADWRLVLVLLTEGGLGSIITSVELILTFNDNASLLGNGSGIQGSLILGTTTGSPYVSFHPIATSSSGSQRTYDVTFNADPGAGFNGLNPNGQWALDLWDNSHTGIENRLTGWSLNITAVPEPVNVALLVLGAVFVAAVFTRQLSRRLAGRSHEILSRDDAETAARSCDAPVAERVRDALVARKNRLVNWIGRWPWRRGVAATPNSVAVGIGRYAVRARRVGAINTWEYALDVRFPRSRIAFGSFQPDSTEALPLLPRVDNSGALRHAAAMSKPALGRGLGALLGGNPPLAQSSAATATPPAATADDRERVQRVALNRVRPSALQPRKDFAPESLQELADSIREQGIVQPLIVRERGGFFELIAGERRWRAAQLLNLAEVPVIAREADDRAVLELALIENLQRENLNPLEEALGYQRLSEQFQLTQEEISVKVGKSRASVANATRLLKLPVPVQLFLREGRLSVGHAKVILGLPDEQGQVIAAERVVKDGLNVRQTEGLIAKLQVRAHKPPGQESKPRAIVPVDANLARLEEKLREKFGTKIHLKYAQGKGAVEISFFSDEELQRVLEILNVNAD